MFFEREGWYIHRRCTNEIVEVFFVKRVRYVCYRRIAVRLISL